MADVFLDLIRRRRTCYSLKAQSPVSDERILQIASEIIKHTPSSFNCQSTRYVILLRNEHVKFWEIAKECFKATMSKKEYEGYMEKLDGRQAGYGTVLLFEDLNTIREYQKKFPRVVWHLQSFSEHQNAMSAFNLWTALSLEGFGCNFQHVNPVVDQRVVSEWNVPPSWSLKAQLVFGTPTGEPGHQKTFKSVEERIIVPGFDGKDPSANGSEAVIG